MNQIRHLGMILVDSKTNEPMLMDQEVTTFRGERYTLKGGKSPHSANSTGRVWVQPEGLTRTDEFYPSVIDAKWIDDSDAR
jgi:hypothetical protein